MLELADAGRRRRKQARPRELLDAALAVIVEKGFAAAWAEEIAARAGVSKGTLYLYCSTWHLDEMFVTLRGDPYLLWRAVDQHGAELDILLQKHRDKLAANASSRACSPPARRHHSRSSPTSCAATRPPRP
jgi:AcrR family transcriptional regulator